MAPISLLLKKQDQIGELTVNQVPGLTVFRQRHASRIDNVTVQFISPERTKQKDFLCRVGEASEYLIAMVFGHCNKNSCHFDKLGGYGPGGVRPQINIDLGQGVHGRIAGAQTTDGCHTRGEHMPLSVRAQPGSQKVLGHRATALVGGANEKHNLLLLVCHCRRQCTNCARQKTAKKPADSRSSAFVFFCPLFSFPSPTTTAILAFMKILIVGSGGREHTLAWKLAGDSCKPTLFCAPGNAGTAQLATNLDIKAEDVDAILQWATQNKPDLTVVGPEAPLCLGLIDKLTAAGLRAFGPTADGARMEGSKVFSKDVMTAGGVPTAHSETFTHAEKAIDYAKSIGGRLVIKADGLAAGKGVLICSSIKEAEDAIKTTMVDQSFGDAGKTILIEEFLEGEEASILALVDGEHIVMLACSQDHKRVFDNDEGPNTGGMGAYSPAPVVTEELWPIIREQVFARTLTELQKRGIVFKGILYAGLMISGNDIKALEFNCRFGDPETQAVLIRMKSDLLPALEACVDGTLSDDLVAWHDEAAACVVMASGGYPASYEKGKIITGLDKASELDGVVVFHAGTALDGDTVVTSGGRVLGVTALGADLEKAVAKAYGAVSLIGFEGAQHRTDIAAKAFLRV